MANKKRQKLELTWIGKEKRPNLEPRILLEDPELSYHSEKRVAEGDQFDNKLIFGDNLLALKALEQEYAGKVKCIYIDPPYNTGQAFENYDDGVEHSLWLSLMKNRLTCLRELVSDDGFFCCQIDDNESAYLKVLLDELFGRSNYLTTLYIQVRYANKTLSEDSDYQKVIEQVFVYCKNRGVAKVNKEKEPYKLEKFHWNIVEKVDGKELFLGGKKVWLFKDGEYEIKKVSPSLDSLKETWATGSLVRQTGSSGEFLDKNLAPRKNIDGLSCLYKVDGIGKDGLGYRYMTGPKKIKATKGKFYSGIPLKTLDAVKRGSSDKDKPIQNFYDLAGFFGNCRHEGSVDFRGGKKPERLLELILYHFSNPGDLVLDSFAGSGTTGAVAHKMGRKWIMIELGEHCHTHIIPRMKKVIDGEDLGGISKVTNWQGGGGFRYYKLAPSLILEDQWGQPIINPAYNADMLAEAMCKHMGYHYAPSKTQFWNHGYSTETDYIYVTTQALGYDHLRVIHEELGDKTLTVCCKAYRKPLKSLPNLSLKKIPQAVLERCEWGRDDYSLNVEELSSNSDDAEHDKEEK